MVFSGIPFIFMFFAVTLLVYYLVPRKAKNIVLLITSLFFYSYGEPVYIFLMLFSITMNYVSGLLIGKFSDNPKAKKTVLIICIILNIGLLGFFKYTGLLVGTLKMLPVFSFLPNPDIALPIGISFYTFQTMSYVIDAYWGNCKPQKNFINFGTYVSLFPQLIAGPIVRYVDIEEQLQNRKETPELFNKGVKLFIVGLAKKVLLANQLGALWDQFKVADTQNGILGSWFGILTFTLQIYFDFSGYSDMACGLGNMFGFNFVKNFDYPYVSSSITEFWRRWHISLGTWFREYVYIPLGGNRKGKLRLILNLLIVWGLTGIWHGASWNFLLWGLYFGLILIFEKFLLLKIFKKLPKFISHIYALFFIILGWAIFDFTDMSEMGRYIGSMFTLQNGIVGNDQLSLIVSHIPIMLISIFACLPITKNCIAKINDKKIYKVVELIACIVIVFLCTASLVNSTYNPFLYFRF